MKNWKKKRLGEGVNDGRKEFGTPSILEFGSLKSPF